MPYLFLIRHGENDYVGKRLAGRTPGVILNERGRHQAEALIHLLEKVPVQSIFSSPLERAMQTAEPIAAALNLPVQDCEGLIETDFGKFQGKTFKQLKRTKLWPIVDADPALVTFPNGESIPDVQARVVATIESIAATLEEKQTALLFTHSDPIRLALTHYLNMQLQDFHRLSISPGSVSVVVIGEKRPLVPYINLVPEILWHE